MSWMMIARYKSGSVPSGAFKCSGRPPHASISRPSHSSPFSFVVTIGSTLRVGSLVSPAGFRSVGVGLARSIVPGPLVPASALSLAARLPGRRERQVRKKRVLTVIAKPAIARKPSLQGPASPVTTTALIALPAVTPTCLIPSAKFRCGAPTPAKIALFVPGIALA